MKNIPHADIRLKCRQERYLREKSTHGTSDDPSVKLLWELLSESSDTVSASVHLFSVSLNVSFLSMNNRNSKLAVGKAPIECTFRKT